jgi:hypothetical protein
MRGTVRPLRCILGAGVIGAMVAGISLPNAMAASIHHNASAAHHVASAVCKAATGTYVVGHAADSAGPNGGGVISGTVTLAAYTPCGAATAGSFSAAWAPPRIHGIEPMDSSSTGSADQPGTHGNGQGNTHGKGKGKGGAGDGDDVHGTNPVTSTTTISGTNALSTTATISITSVLSTTGTFIQDPAHPNSAADVLVSGSATIGQLGSACQTACTAGATVAVTQTITFANVSGRLTIHRTGKSTKVTLMFLSPLSGQVSAPGHGFAGRPVILMGRRANS